MQLILSGVLHLDVPTGNVPLKAVQELAKNPMVASFIPISLGDSFQSYRIVGTTPAYIDHYGARLAQGQLWQAPMQVVLGATAARQMGLSLGHTFAGSHGLGGGGDSHSDKTYTVVGVLQPSASVLDRLILTDTASVWQVHEAHSPAPSAAQPDLHADAHADAHADEPARDYADVIPTREITLALVKYTTPLAAITFPRFVNSSTDMQAAAPALEITRLLHMLGLGTDVLRAFVAVLLLTAGLSVFIALWSAVRERRADLALLRMLGAPPTRVAALLLSEALWLGLLSAGLGLPLGQVFAATLGWYLQLQSSLLVGGMVWPLELAWVPLLSLGVALGAALLPALGAYRVSVLELLQS
jgi:putative ABC transport system permease protein